MSEELERLIQAMVEDNVPEDKIGDVISLEKKKEKFTNCFGLEMEREIDEKKTKDDGEPDGV